ncbi:MAG: hypothetical protein ACRDF4_09595 [Rhabdochlamydiaceae bacterium]
MGKKKSQYDRKSGHKALLGEVSQAIQNETAKETAVRTAKDSLTDVGAGVGGGFAGAAMGKYSFLTGFGISGFSHALRKHIGDMGSRIISLFGVGMMAGGAMKPASNGVSGTDTKASSKIADAKERVKTYGEDLLDRTFLSKFIKPKKKDIQTDTSSNTQDTASPAAKNAATAQGKPVGEVQYFIYPNKTQQAKEVDLSPLDSIEEGLHKSAAEYEQKQQQDSGSDAEAQDTTKGANELDPAEKNY